MQIGYAVQKGSFVYIYDEKGRQTAAVPAGTEASDGLKGYTASSVTIQRGSFVYRYDGRGRQVGSALAV